MAWCQEAGLAGRHAHIYLVPVERQRQGSLLLGTRQVIVAGRAVSARSRPLWKCGDNRPMCPIVPTLSQHLSLGGGFEAASGALYGKNSQAASNGE